MNLCYLCAPLLIHRYGSRGPAARLSPELQASWPEIAPGPMPTGLSAALLTPPHSPPAAGATRTGHPSDDASGAPPSDATLARTSTETLMCATAHHPRARKWAFGGYIAPPESKTGGEYRGHDLLHWPSGRPSPSASDSHGPQYRISGASARLGQIVQEDTGVTPMTPSEGGVDDDEPHQMDLDRDRGFRTSSMPDGRVGLHELGDERGGTRCLVCRAGVKGWLRVYTG